MMLRAEVAVEVAGIGDFYVATVYHAAKIRKIMIKYLFLASFSLDSYLKNLINLQFVT